MGGSFSLGRVLGIDIRVHFTFLLYLAILLVWQSWLGFSLLVLVFGSVLLHELGHSVAAQALGVPVHRILLTPLGGIAQLAHNPHHWTHEIAIALAGPLVNFLLVAVLMPLGMLLPTGFLQTLALLLGWANLVLGVFNLLPAFPMDGGRVLRAWLTPRMGPLPATLRAVSLGKWIAVALGLVGLVSGQFMLIVVAFFVYWMGQQEKRSALRRYQFPDFQPAARGPTIYVQRRYLEPW